MGSLQAQVIDQQFQRVAMYAEGEFTYICRTSTENKLAHTVK